MTTPAAEGGPGSPTGPRLARLAWPVLTLHPSLKKYVSMNPSAFAARTPGHGFAHNAFALLGIALAAQAAVAAPAVTNGNFDAVTIADGTIVRGSPLGWTGGSGYFNPSTGFYAGLAGKAVRGTMSGPNVAYFWESGSAPLQQTTAVAVEAGRSYTLTVALGGRTADHVFAGALLELLVNGQVVASRQVETLPNPGSFGDETLTWEGDASAAGGLLTIRISPLKEGPRSYLDIDNVRLLPGLVNGRFEGQPLGDGDIVQSPPPGWSGGTGTYNPTSNFYTALTGKDLNGSMSGPTVGFMWGASPLPLEQTTPTTIEGDSTYTVRASLGARTNGNVFAGVALELLANGEVVATKLINTPPLPGGFGDVALSWQADAASVGKRLGVRFRALRPAYNTYVDIDNVRLSAETGQDWTVGIANAGFEGPALPSGGISLRAPDFWNGGTGSYHPDASFYPGLTGSNSIGTMDRPQVAYLWGNKPQALSQTTNSRVVPGATYTLAVASGERTRSGNVYAGLKLQITADGNPVASVENILPPVPGSFGDVSLNWTAPDNLEGATLGVRVVALNPGPLSYVDIDNVRFTAVGPVNGVTSPVPRQVLQRTGTRTAVPVSGNAPGADQVSARLVARAGFPGTTTPWTDLRVKKGGSYSGAIPKVIGGWYDLEVRAMKGSVPVSSTTVPRVGVGEIFITAGQSNSANWGDVPQLPGDDRVSATTWAHAGWQFAADPQPIADGPGGSPWPAFGTRFAGQTGLPVAVMAVGVGGSSVTQWQPTAALYPRLLAAIKAAGPNGVRAILWHQGETDASLCMSTATYVTQLSNVISATRNDAGWAVPWGVATASKLPWNNPGCEQAINAAQAQVVSLNPSVFAGPDTNGYYGAGLTWDTIHFNTSGLTLHGQSWVDSLNRWGGVPAR